MATGDFEGNGITDLVVANANDNTVSVLLGNGNGTFQPAVNYSMSDNTQVANFPGNLTVGRLRSNGPLDIVMTNFGTSNVTVLLGNGDGTFGAPIHLDAGVGNDAAAIADFDDDGTPDILVTNYASDTVALLPGNGDGTFRAPVQFATSSGPFAMSVGHFDSHNLPEVAVLGTTTISVLLNDSVILSSNAPSLASAPAAPLLATVGERIQQSNVLADIANPFQNSAGGGSLSRIDTFFQAFDAMLRSLESRIEAMDPQSIAFFQMLNAELGALESGIAGHPLTI